MNYSVRPQEHQLGEARRAVESAVESCQYILEKEEQFDLNLGGSSDAEYGAHGSAVSPQVLQIYFNPEIENWKEELQQTAVNLYGKAWFYEKTGSTEFIWQEFLASITGLMLLDRTDNTKEPEKNDLKQEWAEKKEDLSEELDFTSPERFSWELKLEVGRKLLEEHGLEELPKLTRSDVLEAGDELFQ